jgi:hypothetical protein
MPRLSSWGKGGYIRSSIAKRVREILNIGNEPRDSLGLTRIAMSDESGVGPWNYGPEDPRISPILSYHHQYDFKLSSDVDLVETWQETGAGIGGNLDIVELTGKTYGVVTTGPNLGNFWQYQERVLTYYVEEGTEQDLWFQTTLQHSPDPNAVIYFGYTPVKNNAIRVREYGIGFQYEPSNQTWYFVIDNIVDGSPERGILALAKSDPDGMTLGFKVIYPKEVNDMIIPGSGVIHIMWATSDKVLQGQTFPLSENWVILDQPLKMTFGIENMAGESCVILVDGLKEVIPKWDILPEY